ncbi:hypothetical protein FKP32DRAFT_1592090 [Trametes sanguinea]|nr:hypothetical protein FKP32DRAFT_1592090 [Trametes sanguinea]
MPQVWESRIPSSHPVRQGMTVRLDPFDASPGFLGGYSAATAQGRDSFSEHAAWAQARYPHCSSLMHPMSQAPPHRLSS